MKRNVLKIKFSCVAPVVLAGLFLWSVGCSPKTGGGSQKAEKTPVPVVAAESVQKDFDIFLSAFAHVSSYNRVEVKPRVSGHIIGIHFKEGQDVQKGDLLFEIDPRKTEASLAMAQAVLLRDEARLTNAISNYERAQALFEKTLISKEAMDEQIMTLRTAQATVASDQASVNDIELSLEFSRVTSPISGRTGSIQVDMGNVVSAAADTLVTINEVTPISVKFSVSEKYMPQLRSLLKSSQASVKAYNNTTGELIGEGKLDFMENFVDRATGMIDVSARFENADQALWPGQFVRVEMLLEKIPSAVVVPSIAVQTGQDGPFVYVIKPDNTLELRSVKVGEQRGLESVIESGLDAGEQVVSDGQLRLTPDAKVKIYSSLDAAVESVLSSDQPAGTNANPGTLNSKP